MDKPRAKEMYPACIRAMFDAVCLEYNDYDRNIIRIQNQPFKAIKIPKADIIRKILTVTPDTKRSAMAQDVAKLITYLVGINTVDLFYMDNSCYDGEKLKYNRHKMEGERSDKAYIEISVHEDIKPLLKNIKAK